MNVWVISHVWQFIWSTGCSHLRLLHMWHHLFLPKPIKIRITFAPFHTRIDTNLPFPWPIFDAVSVPHRTHKMPMTVSSNTFAFRKMTQACSFSKRITRWDTWLKGVTDVKKRDVLCARSDFVKGVMVVLLRLRQQTILWKNRFKCFESRRKFYYIMNKTILCLLASDSTSLSMISNLVHYVTMNYKYLLQNDTNTRDIAT